MWRSGSVRSLSQQSGQSDHYGALNSGIVVQFAPFSAGWALVAGQQKAFMCISGFPVLLVLLMGLIPASAMGVSDFPKTLNIVSQLLWQLFSWWSTPQFITSIQLSPIWFWMQHVGSQPFSHSSLLRKKRWKHALTCAVIPGPLICLQELCQQQHGSSAQFGFCFFSLHSLFSFFPAKSKSFYEEASSHSNCWQLSLCPPLKSSR